LRFVSVMTGVKKFGEESCHPPTKKKNLKRENQSWKKNGKSGTLTTGKKTFKVWEKKS